MGYAERDKYATDMDKVKEELERVQGSAGKYQIANEKTQLELDKAHQEIDILREKLERNQGESRRTQDDKAKLLYELDKLKEDLEKATAVKTMLAKEKEDVYTDLG